MIALLVFAAIAAGLYALHRLEKSGRISSRGRRGSSGALGSAFLELQSMLEPGKRHVLEERRREDVEESDEGDPPSPGGSRRDAR